MRRVYIGTLVAAFFIMTPLSVVLAGTRELEVASFIGAVVVLTVGCANIYAGYREWYG